MRAGVLMSKFLITLEGHISEYAQIAGEEIITMLFGHIKSQTV